jgi:mannose-6-phosphate isomerase-like protein (cupin superfamily)
MDIKNIHEILAAAPIDPKVGIKVQKITGDGEISLFAAEIPPGKKVRPHYHNNGIELYQVIRGSGEARIGEGKEWKETFRVKEGTAFSIPAGKTHTLINDGSEPIIVLFICMPEHLGADRFFIE